jgi:uncharacterized RDD family membrane protein YckC
MRRDKLIYRHVLYTFVDMYKLETPESVAVTYPVAGIGSRFLAALIDTLIQLTIVAALAIIMLVIINISGLNTSGAAAYVALAIGILGVTAVLLGYYIFFELIWNGQSPGKRAMRLRVIQISGYPVTPIAVLIRNVLRLVDFLPAYYGIGVITMIVNRNARRLGDLAAGTIVVKEGREGDLSSLPASDTTPSNAALGAARTAYEPRPVGAGSVMIPGARGATATDETAATAANTYGIDASRLTREDEALMRDFLDRRHQLAYDRRNALAYQIAAVVYTHVGGQTTSFTAEGYLEYVSRVVSRES